MNLISALLNLAFLAFLLFYLGLMAFTLLSTRYRLRKTAKQIAGMNPVSRNLTAGEAAACKKIYPRLANRIREDTRVITVTGGYGYTTIRDRYGTESRMNHAIGPVPFHFMQCMESTLNEDTENTAELILLSNGMTVPVTINGTWTAQQEAVARDALDKGNIATASQDGSKLADRNEPPTVREYQTYHPPFRLTASVILLAGIIMLLTWNRDLPGLLLYTGAVLAVVAFLWIVFPGNGHKAKKCRLVSLSGTAVFRGSRIVVDRFLLQVPLKGQTVLEDGKNVLLEGWIHPKNKVTFYTTAIRDSYGETLWSLEKNHWSRNWMRFLIPLIITAVAVLIYADVNSSCTIAKDYLNWRKNGQTVRTFDSLYRLTEELEKPDSVPAGSILNLENFAIVKDPSRPGTDYAYRIMEKHPARPPNFSEARKRAAQLSRLIRTPLATSIFIGTNYPEARLWYISLFIDQFTSDESPADFAEAFPDSIHFTAFREAAAAYEADPGNASPDSLLHSWSAFIREETDAINELIANEVSRTLQNRPAISITSDYHTPEVYYSIPYTYFTESHFDPYQIPAPSSRNFNRSEPRDSWIAETPRYEEALGELEELFTEFPNTATERLTAFVTGSGRTADEEPVLELSFSRYRVERAQQEADKLIILLALAAAAVFFTSALAASILWDLFTKRWNSIN